MIIPDSILMGNVDNVMPVIEGWSPQILDRVSPMVTCAVAIVFLAKVHLNHLCKGNRPIPAANGAFVCFKWNQTCVL